MRAQSNVWRTSPTPADRSRARLSRRYDPGLPNASSATRPRKPASGVAALPVESSPPPPLSAASAARHAASAAAPASGPLARRHTAARTPPRQQRQGADREPYEHDLHRDRHTGV